jgi:CheY-like chemotaxis protein
METSATKSRLLLVDSDPKSLRVLDVSLKNSGFEVITATNAMDGIKALDAQIPDLVISSTDLDGMDGFEFCARMKASAAWSKIPFLFVSNRKSIEDKIRGLELGADDFLTKPIYIREIGIRVRTALQRIEREGLESRREGRTRFSGDLSDVGVVDLIQTIELNRKSGIVHIVTPDGRRGMVYFRDGKVIDAEVGKLSGAMAVYRLFAWSEGNFAVDFKPIRRRDVIDLPVAGLLIEGMRRLDEGARLLESLPSLRSVVDVDFRVLAEQLVDLPDEMNRILRVCDGSRTLQEAVEDSDCPDLEALTILYRLYQTKIIFARDVRERSSHSETIANLAKWLSENPSEHSIEPDDLPVSLGDAKSPSQARAHRKGACSVQPRLDASFGLDPAIRLGDEQQMTQLGCSPVSSELDITKPHAVSFPSPTDSPDVPSFGEALVAEAAVDPSTAVFRLSPETPAPASTDGMLSTTDLARSAPKKIEGQRQTAPLGLAEKLLSEDSEIRATALLQSENAADAIVSRPAQTERTTQPYGQAQTAGATGPNSNSETFSAAALPASPIREVDWGPWKIVPSTEISVASTQNPIPLSSPNSLDDAGEEASTTKPMMGPKAVGPGSLIEKSQGPTEVTAKTPSPMEKKVTSGGVYGSGVTNHTSARRFPRGPSNRRKPLYLFVILGSVVGGLYWIIRLMSAPQLTLPTSPVLEVPLVPTPASSAQISVSNLEKNTPKVTTRFETDTAKHVLYSNCLKTDANGKGRPGEVAVVCRKALQANPSAVDVLLLLSRAELDRGRLEDARNLARKAVTIKPEYAEGYIYLGGAEQELGRVGEARAAYKRYLELSPSGEHARELRAILNSL